MLRLFIAATLPERTKQQIERVVAPLRMTLPAASWTRSESFHLTFAFLGNQDEAIIEPLFGELTSRLSTQTRFEVVASACGFFPNEKHARVAWIALQPQGELKLLSRAVREALRSREVPYDEKPYKPHLTLARIRDRWSGRDLERFNQAMSGFATDPAPVDAVTIYKSQLSPKGAIHTPLKTVSLR